MASVRMAGLYCCRRYPALRACQSTTNWACSRQRVLATTSSLSSIAELKSFGSWFVNSSLSRRSDGFASKFRVSPRSKFFECAVIGRAYHAEVGSSYGRNVSSSNAAQVVYDQYGQQQQEREGEVPRPPMIQWEKNLANAVQLIGNVGRDIDSKYLNSGKLLARTSLAVKKGTQKTEEPSWFEIELWDALAEVAAHHIKKGELIFVAGTIVVDKWVKNDIQHTITKVVVRDLCFVEAYSNQRQPYAQSNVAEQEESIEIGSNSQSQLGGNLSSSQRNWNQQQLGTPYQGTAVPQGTSKRSDEAALATEKRWQEYFTDPTQWWDNRRNKKNPKAPDFKHKSTQEALWLESWNNPPWVSQQMAVLEEKQAQHTGDFGDSRQGSQDKKLSSFKDSDFMY